MTRQRVLARLSAGVLAALLALVATGPRLSAHPTALTHVLITVGDTGTLEVVFTTLGESLVTKLEATGRIPSETDRFPAALEQKIVDLREVLIANLFLQADGRPVPLRWTAISRLTGESNEKDKIAIRLSGRVPARATSLTWTTNLVSGTYPLAIRRTGTAVPTSDDGFEWLTGAEISRTHDLASLTEQARVRRFVRSIWLGFTHIVPKGLDHILFVLGLFLLAARTRTVLMQVTAFTAAHSITLAASLYGVFSVPASVVEPLIALSIVYVAVENLFTSALTPWRLALVFAFGLLHGLGFAEALSALDLPRAGFFSTLVAFNLGVEAGQLSVVLAAALVILALRIPVDDYRRLVVRPASIAIAVMGTYWAIERLV
jgi:hydrogenase/urease accessory protein HupE